MSTRETRALFPPRADGQFAFEAHASRRRRFDAVVIGSGFGGAMAAQVLVRAGCRVLMIERGSWVRRGPENWAPDAAMDLSSHYSMETAYEVRGDRRMRVGGFHCVGGPSVFFGGVALRFRASDFEPASEIASVGWPVSYGDMEPFYDEAERLLGVTGDVSLDPTDPPRRQPLPARDVPLASPSSAIGAAAAGLGLRPFRLPLAINLGGGRPACRSCATCDAYACAVGAKNDVASAILPTLLRRGLELWHQVVVVRLRANRGRITDIDCIDRFTGRHFSVQADHVILAAGALGSAHIVLTSGLDQYNPGGWAVGRHLMRHANAMVFGIFPYDVNPGADFHKEMGINDFYFGDGARRAPAGKLGCIQQVHPPPAGLLQARLPTPLRRLVPRILEHVTGLLVIAEDRPLPSNRIDLNPRLRDRHGLPGAFLYHRYAARDLAARDALVVRARSILRAAGAIACVTFPIRTFSHAVGTLRMGADAESSVLDPDGRFRGVENLYVTDGSVMPTSAGVNPSLTIAANALRMMHRLAGIRRAPSLTVLADVADTSPDGVAPISPDARSHG